MSQREARVEGRRPAVRVGRTARLARWPLLVLAAGCAHHDATVAPTSGSSMRFQITNALLAPVTVAVDGAPIVILVTGHSSAVTVASTARSLTWTAAKPTDTEGRPIPDDIGEVRLSGAGHGASVLIDNVIDGQPYVTASIVNHAPVPAAIGVANGSAVSCAAVLPAAVDDAIGFVRIGYYRLGAATEVRAYRDGARCTGPYVAWPRSLLTSFAAKAGLVVLALDTAP